MQASESWVPFSMLVENSTVKLAYRTGKSGGVPSKLIGAASIMEWLVQAKTQKTGTSL